MDADGGPSVHECVHTGTTCKPVDVATPSVTPGSGLPYEVSCYVGNVRC